MATATTEKTTTSFNPANLMIDAWLRNLNNMCWAQEQGEKIVRSWMDQNQATREEGLKVAARFAEAAKVNARTMQSLMENSLRLSLEAWRVPQKMMVDSFNQSVEQVNAQVEKIVRQN